MPAIAKPLGAAQVARKVKPGLHAVGGVPGLQLQVTPTGARSWVLRIVVGTKRRDIGLGSFGAVTLAQARERARDMRAKVWEGIDPVEQRRAARARLIAEQAKAITFEEAARRAHGAKELGFRNVKHRADWISSLERYAFPLVGSLPVGKVEVAHVQQVLNPIWHTRTETASRLRQRIESVLSWATVSGYRSGDNPARWKDNLKELMPAPDKIRKHVHYAALPWQDVPAFIAEIRKREGVSARALEFAILTAARSGEVRGATWGEVDLDRALWTVPAERMKEGKKHQVPLPPEVVVMLRKMRSASSSGLIFKAPRGGPLSDMALNGLCRRMNVPAVPHGFRSSFKDWCRNNTRYADEVSELCLAHVSSDATRAAYARDALLPQRRELLQAWAKYCSKPIPAMKSAATVTSIRKRRAG